jgi:hypothetical protein
MKNNFMLAAVFSLFVFAFSASAQEKATNFSGTWNLDVSKSKLGDRVPIESQTLTVTQTDKDIKVETVTKHAPPPADAPQGMEKGGGKMGGHGHRGGGMMGGDGTTTYNLDGKETKTEVSGPMGSMPVSLKAKIESGKLNLSRSSSFSGPMGDMTMTSKETWELSSDGNTLTVNAERSSPRGNETTTKIFTKKS